MNSAESIYVRKMIREAQIWNQPLSEIRATMASIPANGLPEGIRNVKTDLQGVPCDVLMSSEQPSKKAVLYFHGGGFCLGVYDANRAFVAGIAARTGFDVFLPDYRLAPENPFPAALDDAVAAYQGLIKRGYDVRDIVVTGDSSGCALALSALLVLKQSGIALPGLVICITPVFDLTGTGETFVTRAQQDPFGLKDPLGIAKIYVGQNDSFSPLLSPLYGELNGLPDIIIHAADDDVFLSDAVRFAEKATQSNVKAELKIWQGMWHIFPMQQNIVPESKQAMELLCSQIKNS